MLQDVIEYSMGISNMDMYFGHVGVSGTVFDIYVCYLHRDIRADIRADSTDINTDTIGLYKLKFG